MEIVDPVATSRRSLLHLAGLAATSFALPRWAFRARLERMKAFAEEMGDA